MVGLWLFLGGLGLVWFILLIGALIRGFREDGKQWDGERERRFGTVFSILWTIGFGVVSYNLPIEIAVERLLEDSLHQGFFIGDRYYEYVLPAKQRGILYATLTLLVGLVLASAFWLPRPRLTVLAYVLKKTFFRISVWLYTQVRAESEKEVVTMKERSDLVPEVADTERRHQRALVEIKGKMGVIRQLLTNWAKRVKNESDRKLLIQQMEMAKTETELWKLVAERYRTEAEVRGPDKEFLAELKGRGFLNLADDIEWGTREREMARKERVKEHQVKMLGYELDEKELRRKLEGASRKPLSKRERLLRTYRKMLTTLKGRMGLNMGLRTEARRLQLMWEDHIDQMQDLPEEEKARIKQDLAYEVETLLRELIDSEKEFE